MEMEMDFDSISNLENRQKTLFKIKQIKLEAGGSGCAATAFFILSYNGGGSHPAALCGCCAVGGFQRLSIRLCARVAS